MMVQSLLRHAMAEAISDGIINCLIVTSSAEANVQLTRIHEHLFARKWPSPSNLPASPDRATPLFLPIPYTRFFLFLPPIQLLII